MRGKYAYMLDIDALVPTEGSNNIQIHGLNLFIFTHESTDWHNFDRLVGLHATSPVCTLRGLTVYRPKI